MLVPPDRKRSFYQLVSGNVVRPGRMVPSESHKDGGYTGLVSVEQRCALLAMVALDMGLGVDASRDWLAEAAGCYVDMQERTGRSTGFKALRTTFRIGTCHDTTMLQRWSRGYLATPYGSDRNRVNTQPENHYWHFAQVLALFHSGRLSRLDEMLEDLMTFGPCRGWKHSAAWFDAMRALAFEALSASRPNLSDRLATVGSVNQAMFAPKGKESFYEAWFAEMAMAFIPAALTRGWVLPTTDPHRSMPLALFRLPSKRIVIRPWVEFVNLGPDQALAARITAAAA